MTLPLLYLRTMHRDPAQSKRWPGCRRRLGRAPRPLGCRQRPPHQHTAAGRTEAARPRADAAVSLATALPLLYMRSRPAGPSACGGSGKARGKEANRPPCRALFVCTPLLSALRKSSRGPPPSSVRGEGALQGRVRERRAGPALRLRPKDAPVAWCGRGGSVPRPEETTSGRNMKIEGLNLWPLRRCRHATISRNF